MIRLRHESIGVMLCGVTRRYTASTSPYLQSDTHQRSYLGGPQCQSHMRTGPAIAIGTDHHNEARKKAYVSKEMHLAFAVGDRRTPGPGQYAQASGVRLPCALHLPTPQAPRMCCHRCVRQG